MRDLAQLMQVLAQLQEDPGCISRLATLLDLNEAPTGGFASPFQHTLVGEELGEEGSVQPVLCRLTTRVLVEMAVSDAALLELAVLPNLKPLSVLGCAGLSFCYREMTRLGVAAAHKAAPQLKLTIEVQFHGHSLYKRSKNAPFFMNDDRDVGPLAPMYRRVLHR